MNRSSRGDVGTIALANKEMKITHSIAVGAGAARKSGFRRRSDCPSLWTVTVVGMWSLNTVGVYRGVGSVGVGIGVSNVGGWSDVSGESFGG
jgi:hypothetical protein